MTTHITWTRPNREQWKGKGLSFEVHIQCTQGRVYRTTISYTDGTTRTLPPRVQLATAFDDVYDFLSDAEKKSPVSTAAPLRAFLRHAPHLRIVK